VRIEVQVPEVGESISSGILSVWHKKNGEQAHAGEALFSLETDKISTEINAPESGVVSTLVSEGDEVRIGQVVATVEVLPARMVPASPSLAVPKKAPMAASFASSEEEMEKKEEDGFPPKEVEIKKDSRITRKRLSPLRKKIAAQLVSSQQSAAILTTFNECDMSAVIRIRKHLQGEFQKQHKVKLGFMSFFIKAAVSALRAVPIVNSRIEGDELIQNHFYNIGVAVGTERGLIVPVLRDCEQRSFADLERELLSFAMKARSGKVALEDLQDGIFTISNGGVYGSLLSTPILNPPQSGILGMHKIQERTTVMQGQIVIRPMMYLALSYDHRIIDGKEAATFLVHIKDCVENPTRLLLVPWN
jgi:2-oxoglutarate dehydrogenase E2 component (dihydrolipoamide succinyltransferase)